MLREVAALLQAGSPAQPRRQTKQAPLLARDGGADEHLPGTVERYQMAIEESVDVGGRQQAAHKSNSAVKILPSSVSNKGVHKSKTPL